MNLGETKNTILKWMKSCETDEQLDLMEGVIQRFIVETTPEEYKGFTYLFIIADLEEQMQIQRKQVVYFSQVVEETPTLFLNKK